MESENPVLKEMILEVVDNQLSDNEPEETGRTLKRLMDSGISKENARIYIGQAVSIEIWNVMQNKTPFNEKRYLKNLKRLPKFPKE